MKFTNPYLYVMKHISGKWKVTILHHIYNYGFIRFNKTIRTLPVSKKVLNQQLKELEKDGLIQRIQYQTIPLKVEYILTEIGKELIPAFDKLYIWSIKRMHERNIPIDPDAFVVHQDKKYYLKLKTIYQENNFIPNYNDISKNRKRIKKNNPK